MAADQLTLTLPARPEFVSLARLTLAGLAARLDYDVDAVEDIRVAVAEAVGLLLREGGADTVVVSAQWSRDQLAVTVSRAGHLLAREAEETGVALLVMEAMVDSAVCETTTAGSVVRLTKQQAL
ncbi:MAG: ATP-binding protein [Fimbriimonadaceae bacterium]|nr:ATP-binding protein [Fimbriimonadaceae bacterium]